MSSAVLRANSRDLPLADNSVDLVVTSPPYFALRSYQDGCPDCENTGRAKRPDSHGMKVCPACGNVANRKRCNRCGESMKWPPRAEQFTDEACQSCNGTGKGHYVGQIGDEPTPAEFVESLLTVTRECVRVLKPSGSLWVNLGDKYAGSQPSASRWHTAPLDHDSNKHQLSKLGASQNAVPDAEWGSVRPKSLIGIPWRYAIRCIDDLGLILRAEVIWSKPNGLPESVTDRVRRSHEQWFHFTLAPRYYSAVDEIREQAEQWRPQAARAQQLAARYGIGEEHRQALLARGLGDQGRSAATQNGTGRNTERVLALAAEADAALGSYTREFTMTSQSLGKLPGSVWTIPTEPLQVPDHLGVDHFAAFPTEFPRRIIQGWSPAGVCVACGEGRRPVTVTELEVRANGRTRDKDAGRTAEHMHNWRGQKPVMGATLATITGEACACPEPTAPTTPGVVLDPFGGTGTTALVAKALGRHGVSVDMSSDYCRLATWRTNDPKQLAKAARKPFTASEAPIDGQGDLLDLLTEETA